jgi:prolyl-tRNA synthetase
MANSPITPREKDFAAWYQDVVLAGDMAEPAEIVKGCMVIKPNGYAVWEILQRELDNRFKATGHQNIYLPLLIPQSFLEKEAEHVEGFAPELAVVTIAGGKKLEEPYVIRPTSETLVGHFFAKWIQSYRDLPVLVNQWANIIRWELRTRMFLRTTEFLWQEGHTAHANHAEALEEVFRSYSIEAMMQNGLALQAGTSHDLGQNFGKAFNVQFQTNEGKLDYVWQTSWGVSTRLIGGLIMTHSDDKGLVLPPKAAPRKAVLVPIYRKDEERAQVMEVAARLAAELGAHIDAREGLTPGSKFFYWERRGVPVVFELGPRDVESGNIVIKRRDTGSKEIIPQTAAPGKLAGTLESMQKDLYAKAKQRLKDNTVMANSIDEVQAILGDVTAEKGGGKFVMVHLADDPAGDARIKEFKATVRNIPSVDEYDGPGKCIVTGAAVDRRVVIAKAY